MGDPFALCSVFCLHSLIPLGKKSWNWDIPPWDRDNPPGLGYPLPDRDNPPGLGSIPPEPGYPTLESGYPNLESGYSHPEPG